MRVNFLSAGTSGFPAFQPGTLSPASVSENTPVGAEIARVTASSPRQGLTLTYALVGGNVGHAFSVSQYGEVKVRAALNRETTPEYSLWIEVSFQSLKFYKPNFFFLPKSQNEFNTKLTRHGRTSEEEGKPFRSKEQKTVKMELLRTA